jgi:uncharacterized protein YbjT (DUF2867 family)
MKDCLMAARPRFLIVSLLAVFSTLATFSTIAIAQDSTEPPPPKASPVISVMEVSLPRAGGILVFGGTRGIGLEVVKHLLARNEHVTVMARTSSDTAALKQLGVNVVTGDALDPESVKQAFTAAPFRAVISTLGGREGNYKVDIYGNKNVIDATKNAGLDRFLLVTAIGAGDSNAGLPWYIRYSEQWFMKGYFAAKTTAEDYLKASGLEYTIVRPGILVEGEGAGEPMLFATSPLAITGIKRADVGKLVAAAVEDITTFNKVFAAIDNKRTGLWAFLTY